MVTPSPATLPAPAGTTPGSGEHVGSPPVGSPPAPVAAKPGEQGGNQAGTVTISVAEFRRLQRADARTQGFNRRAGLRPRPNQPLNPDPSGIGEPNEALARAERERDEANERALQADVRDKVRDLFTRPEYANIPQTTKDLILEKPHMLSEAENLEDAMLDIQDRLDELAGKSSQSIIPAPNLTPNLTVPSRETPPVVAPGSPAPVDGAVMEDTTKLSGPARSQAILRNKMRESGIKKGA